MNAVEIEEAVTALAEEVFDATEFPFAFLQAFSSGLSQEVAIVCRSLDRHRGTIAPVAVVIAGLLPGRPSCIGPSSKLLLRGSLNPAATMPRAKRCYVVTGDFAFRRMQIRAECRVSSYKALRCFGM
jgi:hypothetical protein